MPIIETEGLGGPLRQGDLLRGLQIFVTHHAHGAVPLAQSDFGLVLSRHCNALRSEPVLVISIKPWKAAFLKELQAEGMTLDKARRILASLRDGDGQPDVFYLGELSDNDQARYCARLDSVHTLVLPSDPGERQAWVDRHRFARLSHEHRRHLHMRLLGAIASEGFDDLAWWSTRDLEFMILIGEQDLHGIEKDLTRVRMQIAEATASQEPNRDKKIKDLHARQEKLNETREVAEHALQAYRDEARAR